MTTLIFMVNIMRLSKILERSEGNRTLIKQYPTNGTIPRELLTSLTLKLQTLGYGVDQLSTTLCVNTAKDGYRLMNLSEAQEVFNYLTEFDALENANYGNRETVTVNVVYDPLVDMRQAYEDGNTIPLANCILYPKGSVLTRTHGDVALIEPTAQGGIHVCMMPRYIRSELQAKDFLRMLDITHSIGVLDNERKRELRASHLHFFNWAIDKGYELIFPRAGLEHRTVLAETYVDAKNKHKHLEGESSYAVSIAHRDDTIENIGAVIITPSNDSYSTVTDFTDNDLLNSWHYEYSKYLQDTQYMTE